MRKTLAWLLALCMAAALLSQTAFCTFAREDPYSGSCGPELEWSFNPDIGALTITGSGEMTSAPWREQYSFNSEIRSISLPDGMTSMCDQAFCGCSQLTEIAIPASVSVIPKGAFENCTALTAVTIPEGVVEIKDSFQNCTGLTHVEFPQSMRIVGAAFGGCTALRDVEIPEGVVELSYTFMKCTALTRVELPQSVRILDGTFCDCNALEEVNLPEELESIGHEMFYGCERLEVPAFPECVKNVGADALSGTLTYEDESNWEDGAFYFCNWLLQYRADWQNSPQGTEPIGSTVPETLTVRPGTVGIAGLAFADAELRHIELPDTLQYICGEAFLSANLESIELPASLERIGRRAFTYAKFNQLVIPEGVQEIGQLAFFASALESVTIPGSVIRIGDNAFAGCESLSEVQISDGVQEIRSRVFANCPNLHTLVIPASVKRIGIDAMGFTVDMLEFTAEELQQYYDLYFLGPVPKERQADFTIYGYYGTGAQTYANRNGIPFVPLNAVTPFPDVAAGSYYYDAVLWAICHDPQITDGTSDTTFSPNRPCSRAEIVTFLWRAAGAPDMTDAAAAGCAFTDVDPSAYYYDAVLWALEKGITDGTSDTTFSPDVSCTREQAVTFLWRSAGEPEPRQTGTPFQDVGTDSFAYKAVLWALEKGITDGTGEGAFSPGQICTRAQIVTFLFRAAE